MPQDRYFSYKKSQIEKFVKNEFKKKFRSTAKISVRKRHKFISEMMCDQCRVGKHYYIIFLFV